MKYIYQVVCDQPLTLGTGSNQFPMVFPATNAIPQGLIVRDKVLTQEDPNHFYPTVTLELIERQD